MTSELDPCPPTVDRRVPLRTATAHDRHDGSTVRLAGELDLATAGLFVSVVDHELARGRRSLSIDVAELDFLDCTGLRALVDARTRTLAARGRFVLTGVGPRTARLLDVTGLDAMLAACTLTSTDVS